MKPCRVLVTGAGAGVGEGIVKALRLCDPPVTIICTDIAPFRAALYRADDWVILPKVEDPGALDAIVTTLNEMAIDVVMIGSEFDLAFFAEHKERIEDRTSALVICSPLETVRIAGDKWRTAEFLRENGLPFARAEVPADLEDALAIAADMGFPLMLKPRFASASRQVHVVHSADAIRDFFPYMQSPLLQELVDIPSPTLKNEFTCSIFRTHEGDILGPFTARRSLRWGTSWHIEVGTFPELHPLLLDIAAKLPSMGTLNVQLIVGPRGPVPFEFNARFSGTTAVRAHFGFNEPEMALRSHYLGQAMSQPAIRNGVCMRYLEEVFFDDVSAEDVSSGSLKGTVRQWF
jgi:carbamoyl-phosphate synthase large subunit